MLLKNKYHVFNWPLSRESVIVLLKNLMEMNSNLSERKSFVGDYKLCCVLKPVTFSTTSLTPNKIIEKSDLHLRFAVK